MQKAKPRLKQARIKQKRIAEIRGMRRDFVYNGMRRQEGEKHDDAGNHDPGHPKP